MSERLLVLRREPSLATDAYEDPANGEPKIVVLGGAIKWWWQATCLDCGHWDDEVIMRAQRCPAEGHRRTHNCYVWWDSIEHRVYCAWRDAVRASLIDAGYLTYAPWMAFKGRWNERAQKINDAVIETADALVILSPDYAITEGTDSERRYAEFLGVPVIEATAPARDEARLFRPALAELLGTLGSL